MNNNFKLDFIGVGAQKSATSWVYKMLLEHPQICGFSGKETHFFSNEEKYKQGINFYQEFFKNCDQDKITGEFSPDYLTHPKAPRRIKQFFPDIKIIVCLRNPADRAFSRIRHLKFRGRISRSAGLDECLEKFPEIIEKGLYGKYITEYFKLFPSENICIVFYDDIASQALKTIQKIYEFLGVDHNYAPKEINVKINSSVVRFSKIHKFINKLYLKLKKRRLGLSIIAFFRKIGLNYYTVNKALHKEGKKYQVDIAEKQKLLCFFKEDIIKLEKLLKIDLSNWKQKYE